MQVASCARLIALLVALSASFVFVSSFSVRVSSAMTEDDRNSEIQAVLSADRDAIRKAACRMRELSGNAYSAVICDKSEKNTGVIIDLPV